MPTNDFVPFGTGAGATVMSQSDYLALAALSTGFGVGIAQPEQVNKVWRQSTFMAAVLGQFIVNQSGQDQHDDGDLTGAVARLSTALRVGITIIQQIFTSSGTLALPANCFAVQIEGLAGGGGGGGAYGQPAYNVSAGTGGASGAYFKKTYTAAQCGTAAVMAIGAAGLGGAAGQNNGSAGGNTSFTPSGSGTACSATGGGGGPFGITSTVPNRGGFLAGSSNASGGDINIHGQPGSWPLMFGGSSAYQCISGNGGNSLYWPGGQSSQENAAGNIAQGYGAGGGGGAALTTSTAGGNGYQGCIIATFFCFNL